jgi:thiol-disulfide isomerase/thioredoxin
MAGTLVIRDNNDVSKVACCSVAFLFLFVIMIIAICWTNKDSFEGFTDTIKFNNETIMNVLGGGRLYKSMGPRDDVMARFKSIDKSNKPALVAILAPWCGYCKTLKESGELRKVAKHFHVLTMDDKHPQTQEIMHLLQAEGFPALGIYFQGQLLPYRGDRHHKEIIAAMGDIPKENPTTTEHMTNSDGKLPKGTTKAEYDNIVKGLVGRGEKVVTVFMADWCGHCKTLKASGALEQLTGAGIHVLVADDETTLTQEMKIQGFPTMYCASQRGNVKYEGGREPREIMAFLTK